MLERYSLFRQICLPTNQEADADHIRQPQFPRAEKRSAKNCIITLEAILIIIYRCHSHVSNLHLAQLRVGLLSRGALTNPEVLHS